MNKSQIINSGSKVATYIKKHKKLPEYVKSGSQNLTVSQYLYAISSVISGKNNVTIIKVKEKFYVVSKISRHYSYSQYKKMAIINANYISSYKKTKPNTVTTSGKVDYYNTVYLFSKVAQYYKKYGKMPGKIYLVTPLTKTARKISSSHVDKRISSLRYDLKTIKKQMSTVSKKIKKTKKKSTLKSLQKKYNALEKKYNSIALRSQAYKRLKSSSWYVPPNLRKYLQSTAYCNIKNPSIVYMARKLSGNDSYTTGNNIFSWVRDNTSYEFYYRTKYGAFKALKYRKGNCVDEAHLIVAMARSAGLPARYVRGNCKFVVSGNYYTHVWAQIWIKGRGWLTADPTSYSNSFGVIRGWDRKKSTIYGTLLEYSL